MIEVIRKHLGLTTLRYQKLDDMIAAIGLPRERLCTYCWDGAERRCAQPSPGRMRR
jgi:amidophosphoribosyltransferase